MNSSVTSSKLAARNRLSTQLGPRIEKNLAAYAASAAAAGVGILALAQPAEAKIVYTPAHVVIKGGTHYYLDLNHGHVNNFEIVNACLSCSSGLDGPDTSVHFALVIGGSRYRNGSQFGWNKAVVVKKFQQFAAALPAGSSVGTKKVFHSDDLMGNHSCSDQGGCWTSGSWLNVINRYLGLRVNVKGKLHYGWARLSVTYGPPFTATLTGYAYETVPNKAIITGKKSENDQAPDTEALDPVTLTAPTPNSATLGALATGSHGLSAWRERNIKTH